MTQRSQRGNEWYKTTVRSRAGRLVAVGGAVVIATGACVHDVAAIDGGGACAGSWDNAIGQPGFDNSVMDLLLSDVGDGGSPTLFAGGFFTHSGATQVNHIAQRKPGTGQWGPLGGGLNNAVRNMAVLDDGTGDGPALFAGGMFTEAGDVPTNYIARWSPQTETWSAVSSGFNDSVRVLITFDDNPPGSGPDLYAGGVFTMAGDTVVNHVAKWDGKTWSSLGDGLNDWVSAVAVFDDGSGDGPALYVGGAFSMAGDVAVNRIARWDGNAWSPLGAGVNNSVRTLAVFDDGAGNGPALYAGGRFTSAGGTPANFVAKWDGQTWSPVGDGVDDWVGVLAPFDIEGYEPTLFAGGGFKAAGGEPAGFVASWSPTRQAWSALGGGANDAVIDIVTDVSRDVPAVITGGWFTTMDNEPAGAIATWHPAPSHTSGDLNCDGAVNGADLALLLGAWGACGDCRACPADLDGSCTVDGGDLAILLGNWS